MLVRMLVDLSGPGLLLHPGDEHDFPQDEAIRLVSAEFAVPVVEGRAPIETTTKNRPAAERRTRKKPDVVPG